MQIKEFKKFIKKEDKRIDKKFSIKDKEKRILANMVKLTEEVGELADEVLGFYSMQRKDKIDKHSEGELLDEFADVIICTFLLAESMKVDIEKALKIKIKKINQKYKK